MNKIRKAVFMSGYDGIDRVLSLIDKINKEDTLLDLYLSDPAIVPNFLKSKCFSVNKIKQTFYSREVTSHKRKLLDKLDFIILYLRCLVSKSSVKYAELHFLGHLNNPSFLMYEKLLKNNACSVIHYKIPDRVFYKQRKGINDWKLKSLEILFSRKFAYYDFPPKKVAIGLAENELSHVKPLTWRNLTVKFEIFDKKIENNLFDNRKKFIFLGTRLGGHLEEVDFEATAKKISDVVTNEFAEHSIYYKPHYRSDFDLLIPNMKILPIDIPAEFFISYFDVICGITTTTFCSCTTEQNLISCLKLVQYKNGNFEKDLETLKNNSGPLIFPRIKFLTDDKSV